MLGKGVSYLSCGVTYFNTVRKRCREGGLIPEQIVDDESSRSFNHVPVPK